MAEQYGLCASLAWQAYLMLPASSPYRPVGASVELAVASTCGTLPVYAEPLEGGGSPLVTWPSLDDATSYPYLYDHTEVTSARRGRT